MVKSVVDAVREHVRSRVELSVEAIAFIALVLLTPEVILKGQFRDRWSEQSDRWSHRTDGKLYQQTH